MDDLDDSRVGLGQPVGQGSGPVARAIVNDDDLEPLGQCREGSQGVANEGLNVALFIVGREEIRQLRQSRCFVRQGCPPIRPMTW